MFKIFENDMLGTPASRLPTRPPAWATFADYVSNRRYDFGRGTSEAWFFIAFARGDRDFIDASSWRELEHYLISVDAEPSLVRGARSVWRSYTACRSRARQATRSEKAGGR